jgi:AcrR family transcriptional regulator
MAQKKPPTHKKTSAQTDETRDRLLDAAEFEFAAVGLSGARVDTIARRAKVNKQLIYYHFGDKDSLYQAVLERAYARIRGQELQLDLECDDPVYGLRALVAFTFDYCVENRAFVRLLANENVLEGKFIRRSKVIRQMGSPLSALLRDTVQRGVKLGVFRRDVDPVQLYISIAGLCYFYVSNMHTLSTLFERDLDSPTALQERRQHVIDVVLVYLGVDTPPSHASNRHLTP